MSETLVQTPAVDSSKRTWLIASTCVGAVGVGATAVPFVSSFQPSERAKAAGAAVEVDIGGVDELHFSDLSVAGWVNAK